VVEKCSPFIPSLGHSRAGSLMGLQALCMGLRAQQTRASRPLEAILVGVGMRIRARTCSTGPLRRPSASNGARSKVQI
jgi:hypothetical protein